LELTGADNNEDSSPFLHGAMHTVPTLLTGDLQSGMEYMRKGDFTPLANTKFESFKQFAALYPEFRFALFRLLLIKEREGKT